MGGNKYDDQEVLAVDPVVEAATAIYRNYINGITGDMNSETAKTQIAEIADMIRKITTLQAATEAPAA